MKAIDFDGPSGYRRRVLVPDDFDGDPLEGIPVSMDVSELFPGAPEEFRRSLSAEFFKRGLVEPKDFLAPGAISQIRSALLSVLDHDALSIQAFAKERLHV